MKNKKCTGLAFFTGLLVGGIGLALFSPVTGEKLRKMLLYRIKSISFAIGDYCMQLLNLGPKGERSAKQTTEELVKKAEERAKSVLKEVE